MWQDEVLSVTWHIYQIKKNPLGVLNHNRIWPVLIFYWHHKEKKRQDINHLINGMVKSLGVWCVKFHVKFPCRRDGLGSLRMVSGQHLWLLQDAVDEKRIKNQYTTLYYAVLCCTILYYTTLCYAMLCCALLHYTNVSQLSHILLIGS